MNGDICVLIAWINLEDEVVLPLLNVLALCKAENQWKNNRVCVIRARQCGLDAPGVDGSRGKLWLSV